MVWVGSLLFWVFLVASSLALFPVASLVWLVTFMFDRRLVVLHAFTCFWAALYTWLNPAWDVTVEGTEHIDPRATYVMVSNHQSLLDILVLFRLFTHFKWVSKLENFQVPFIGWNMSLNRYIKLKRGDRNSVVGMIAACLRTLEQGSSVLFFPEGTRSETREMRAFKASAFEIAKRANVPILPIALDGAGDALPKSGFALRGVHAIRLRVLKPIVPAQFRAQSIEKLTADVRDLIAREIDVMRGAPLKATTVSS